MSFVISFDK